jgi:hypothetical protein
MNGIVEVTYKYIDGAHFFVSSDKAAAGLCVATNDLFTAYNEVALQLNALFKFNHGQDMSFKPGVPFETFKMYIENAQAFAKEVDHSGMIEPSSVQPWMIDAKMGAQ